MEIFSKNFSGRLRWLLLSLIIIAVGVVLSIFLGSRNTLQQTTEKLGAKPEKSGLTIGKFQHTATRNGITEWSLEASSAEYINENKQAVLHDLAVTFFLKNNGTAVITAEKGVLVTDTFDIEVSGHVVLKNEDYRIETQQLRYDHDKKTIFSDAPIKITGASFSLTADKLRVDLNHNKTVLNGNVKGIFNENFTM